MKTLLPDTNFFLECRTPSELPWHGITNGNDHVHLLVPSAVITEIDRHKKGSGRKARRAREASANFRAALNAAPCHIVEIQKAGPRITLGLPETVQVNYDAFPQLDRFRPDHQIVAEAATMQAAKSGAILSDDTNLILAARAVGYPATLVPDGWKLPHEHDDRDKEITKLKDEVRILQHSRPKIRVEMIGQDGKKVDEIAIEQQSMAPSQDPE